MTQAAHGGALQPPAPDDDADPLEDPPPPEHAPPAHVWPDTHMLHASPPEPHAVGSDPVWHVLVESQHPVEQVACEHPPPSSPPLELPPGPLSSVTPLLLLPYCIPPSSLDPLELPPLLLVEPPPPDEPELLDRSHFVEPAGAVSPAAHEIATSPTTSATT